MDHVPSIGDRPIAAEKILKEGRVEDFSRDGEEPAVNVIVELEGLGGADVIVGHVAKRFEKALEDGGAHEDAVVAIDDLLDVRLGEGREIGGAVFVGAEIASAGMCARGWNGRRS